MLFVCKEYKIKALAHIKILCKTHFKYLLSARMYEFGYGYERVYKINESVFLQKIGIVMNHRKIS